MIYLTTAGQFVVWAENDNRHFPVAHNDLASARATAAFLQSEDCPDRLTPWPADEPRRWVESYTVEES